MQFDAAFNIFFRCARLLQSLDAAGHGLSIWYRLDFNKHQHWIPWALYLNPLSGWPPSLSCQPASPQAHSPLSWNARHPLPSDTYHLNLPPSVAVAIHHPRLHRLRFHPCIPHPFPLAYTEEGSEATTPSQWLWKADAGEENAVGCWLGCTRLPRCAL